MRRRYFFIVLSSLMVVIVFIPLLLLSRTTTLRSVNEFGPFKLGAALPWRAGDRTVWAPPYQIIPESDFYLFIAQRDLWCVSEGCGLAAAQAETMGGFVEVRDIEMPGEKGAEFGFDNERLRKKYDSVTLFGNRDAKIVGIYPNRDIDDLIPILKLHPDLVNFGFLSGVSEFGSLKVGGLSPIQPGDQTGYQPGEEYPYPFAYIPRGKKFYLYAFEQSLLKKRYCAFVGCLPHGFFDYVEELGGWFSSDGQPETAKKFGLDTDKVARGEESLVVVTDPEGIIVAIHPGKTIRDILSILSRLPHLADVSSLYPANR